MRKYTWWDWYWLGLVACFVKSSTFKISLHPKTASTQLSKLHDLFLSAISEPCSTKIICIEDREAGMKTLLSGST